MGHNGDFGYRLGVLFQRGNQRMPYLMIGNHTLFHIGKHSVLFLRTGNHRFKRNQQILLIDRLATLAYRSQGRFVHKVCQIRADRAGCGLRNFSQIHIVGQFDFSSVYLQGIQSALQIRAVYHNLPVKTTCAQQRLIQNLRSVGGGQAHHTL